MASRKVRTLARAAPHAQPLTLESQRYCGARGLQTAPISVFSPLCILLHFYLIVGRGDGDLSAECVRVPRFHPFAFTHFVPR